MPRPYRQLPGESAHSGKSLDLGKLLMDIYGGIDTTNPNAGVDPSTLPDDTGKGMVSVKSYRETQQPYFKPRSILDRRQASLANAEKAYGELQNQQEISNALKLRQGEGDIDLGLLGRRGPINATNQDLMNRIAETHNANLSNQGLLTQNGIPVTSPNEQMYDEMNTPGLQELLKTNILGKIQAAQNAKQQAGLQGRIQSATSEDQLNEAKAKSFIDAGMATGSVKYLPNMVRNQAAMNDIAPILKASEAARQQIMSGREGETLFDINTRKPIYKVPSREESLMDLANRYKQGNNTTNSAPAFNTSPQNQPTGNSGGYKQLDNDTIIIDGKIYKHNAGAAGFNPYSKF